MKHVMLLFMMVFMISSFVMADFSTMLPVVGKPFFNQKGESLLGSPLVFPDHFKMYTITFVAYGFSRKAGDDFDSWLAPFQLRYRNHSDVFFISIPMIGKIPKWIVKQMKKGMKKGIEVDLHPHQMIFSGDTKPFRDYYGFSDKKIGYFLLVDSDGFIVWQGEGKATENSLIELFEQIDSYLGQR